MQKFLEEMDKKAQKKNGKFDLKDWEKIKAVNNIDKITMCTHPIKISHPDANGTSILFEGTAGQEGYLCSGSVQYQDDTLFDFARNIKEKHDLICTFLMEKQEDGKTVFKHLKDRTDLIRDQLGCKDEEEFEEIRRKFLVVRKDKAKLETSPRVKQVYFPVNNGSEYHLLSILAPTKIMLELNQRIKKAKYEGEDIKHSKLTYGGGNPQNISFLNPKIQKSSLLFSCPPIIFERKIELPKRDFIWQCVMSKDDKIQDVFKSLHKIFKNDLNNKEIRERRDNNLLDIIEYIATKADRVRKFDSGWSRRDAYKNLPAYQKIWLDAENGEKREKDENWLEQVIEHITRLLIDYYNKNYGANEIILGDEEYRHILNLVTEHKQVLYDGNNSN